ncbi:MAG: hypothetical protein CME62_11105 [Halobacteriovoraceae bacterium]|nr:hypothetical protein [Halobacteriovoraceae bacterium]|tara:strand:- start:13834 stop:14619 length:786 start_codon:yes stop_codon:yes gene_type:complete
MNKEWLIRTKNNHILGPVSKQKVKQLISNGSIKGDDEVCSGNGYWIYIKEQDLVAKYIFGEEKQNFNPVQEMEPVLAHLSPAEEDLAYPDEAAPAAQNEDIATDEFENLLPSQDDLAYPDMNKDAEDIVESQTDTTMIEVNLDALRDKVKTTREQERSENNKAPEVTQKPKKKPVKKVVTKKTAAPQRRPAPAAPRTQRQIKQKTFFSRNVLIMIATVMFIIACTVVFFRKELLKGAIGKTTEFMLPHAHAQEIVVKKKLG